MLPTEVQRILLLIGLAATAYLMILAWNEDFVQQDVAADYGAAPEVSRDLSTGAATDRQPFGESDPAGISDLEGSDLPDRPQGSAAPSAPPMGRPDSDVPDASLMSRSDVPVEAAGMPARCQWVKRRPAEL